MKRVIDEKDKEILALLEKDSSKTKKQISKELGLPLTTVHNRIVRMQNDNVITGYRASLDYNKLGLKVAAYVNITVDYKTKDFSQEHTARRIKQLPGVESACIVAGSSDIVAKVRCTDTVALNDFLLNRLRKLPGIDKTTTIVILKELE